MLTINKLIDLQSFGIFALTGEADNLSYRMLCDVSWDGRTLLREVYGMKADALPANSETDGVAHVASVMLAYRAWQDIGPIALLSKCHTVFAVANGTIFGLQGKEQFKQAEYDWNSDPSRPCNEMPPLIRAAEFSHDGETWRDWPRCYGDLDRMFASSSNPHVGTRNVHAMTGTTFA